MTTSIDGLLQQVRVYAEAKARELADAFVEQARVFAPYRTGDLSKSIEAGEPIPTGNGWQVVITVGEEHGRYQEEGTGIYGPQGVPITPRPGGVLVFDWPAAGGMVFARSVRGTEPTHWWTRSLQAWPQVVAGVSG